MQALQHVVYFSYCGIWGAPIFMRPVIGITPNFKILDGSAEDRLGDAYCAKLFSAGALPVILPVTADARAISEMALRCDGFLFSGGGDIDPPLFGGETIPACGEVCRERDDFELALLEKVSGLDKPVLGICRGIQTIAVFYGGTLWQDLPSQTGAAPETHRPEHYRPSHLVTVLPDTRLAQILGEGEHMVNSWHHQAVKETALTVSARAPDGFIEAVERPENRFVVGVQWHPEHLEGEQIFYALAQACK